MAKLSIEDQYKIYTYYVGAGFQLGVAYISPIPFDVREKVDRSSSFNIYRTNEGNLRWKDFGSGGELRGDAIDFIIHMEPSIYHKKNGSRFRAAMAHFKNVIDKSNLLTPNLLLSQATFHSVNRAKKVNPIPHYDQEFLEGELNYFCGNPLRFTVEQLQRKRIHGLRGIDWGEGPKFPSTDSDPAFIYDLSEKGDMSSWKAYRPLTKNKRYKWKSWNLTAIPFEGYYMLPEKAPILLFTSSYKDGGVAEHPIIADHFNWVCGNPTGEGAYRSILPHQSELNSRFPFIGVLFDGDGAGVKATNDICSLTGWIPIILEYPLKTGKRLALAKKSGGNIYTKDLAEIVESYGYRFLKNLLIDQIGSRFGNLKK